MSLSNALVATTLLALYAMPAAAQFAKGDADGGVHSMTMLAMPISPRAVGIGEAMAAIDRDPSVIWYNTAGLAGLKTNAFTVNAKQGFAQTQLVGAAVAFPTEIATFGIAARIFNAGTINGTQNSNPIGTFRAYQFALEGGGALQLASWWRWGGTLMFAQEALGDETQGSLGVNSSMQFPDIWKRLTLGGGVRNLGTNVKFDESAQGFAPPLYGYVGGGWDLLKQRNLIQTPLLFRGQPVLFDAKLLGQVNFPDKNEPTINVGGETTVNGVLVARIGYQTGDDNRSGISLGAGVNVGQFRLEYAFRNYKNAGAKFFENDPVGDAHNVSFTYFWGGPKPDERSGPIVITTPAAPVDTASINNAVRRAIQEQLASLRPLLDSLRLRQVQVEQPGDLVSKYIVPVYFGFDSSTVREADVEVLSKVADVIKKIYPTALVTIEGFTDPSGAPEYNNRLSQRRADAVKQVMVDRFKMDPRQFKTVGYGSDKERIVIPNATRDQPGAASNRRVTFTIDATQHY